MLQWICPWTFYKINIRVQFYGHVDESSSCSIQMYSEYGTVIITAGLFTRLQPLFEKCRIRVAHFTQSKDFICVWRLRIDQHLFARKPENRWEGSKQFYLSVTHYFFLFFFLDFTASSRVPWIDQSVFWTTWKHTVEYLVCSPQNIFEAPKQDSPALFSWTTEVDEDLF